MNSDLTLAFYALSDVVFLFPIFFRRQINLVAHQSIAVLNRESNYVDYEKTGH